VFVYGTLCTTDTRYGWAHAAERSEPRLARTPGLIYNYGPFPYALFGDFLSSTIVGQVILMDTDDPAFINMHHVECNSGYEPMIIEATTTDGETVKCLAYNADAYAREFILPGLPRIADGDWNGLARRNSVEIDDDLARQLGMM
jgi:gamma-glutamylcyclotransferase (GGCT)/AIG2-like uncharacterized protein YtfP